MKYRRVTLIRRDPKDPTIFATHAHPGLALPILGTVLENAGCDVRIYVDAIQPPDWNDVTQSDLVGFYVSSACFLETYALADRIREEVGCPIVMGGPHAMFMADEALEHADFVVRGEGETAVRDLIAALEAGGDDYGKIEGLSWRDRDGAVRHNPGQPMVDDFDLVPDQSLIVGMKEYRKRFLHKVFPLGMLVSTSRGCPFTCNFCTIPNAYGTRMRYRSHDAVIADMRQQMELSGHRFIFIADDNFTANTTRTAALLRRIIDERLNIRFSAEVRCDIVTKERNLAFLDLLREAGCELVEIGFESINDATLKFYRKGGSQTRAVIERSIAEFQKRDMLVHGMFVVGGDEDGPGTAMETARFANEQHLDSLQMLPICPLPGTDILRQFESENRVFKTTDDSGERTHIPYGSSGLHVLYRPKKIGAIELQVELMEAYKTFYNAGRAMSVLPQVWSKGLNPVIFRLLGRDVLRRCEPDVRRHLDWLHTLDPSMSARPAETWRSAS